MNDRNFYLNNGYELLVDEFAPINESCDNIISHEDFTGYLDNEISTNEAIDIIQNNSNKKSTSGILGVFEGIFFMPDGYSVNKRFYSKKLWENCLESNRTKSLLEKGMLGTFEHPTFSAPFNSNGELTGSHPIYGGIVTKNLFITESLDSKGGKVGIGRAYILDTPVGRVLNTMLKAVDESGKKIMKLAVSSRAYARNKGKDGKGNDVIDPNYYILEAFDVVLSPGIPQALPKYKASESNIVSESEIKETYNSNQEYITNRMLDILKLELNLK